MHDPLRKWKSRSLVRSFEHFARSLARGEESDESTVAGPGASAIGESIRIVFVSPLAVSTLSQSLAIFRFPHPPYAERFSLADSPPFALPKAPAVLFDRPLMFY